MTSTVSHKDALLAAAQEVINKYSLRAVTKNAFVRELLDDVIKGKRYASVAFASPGASVAFGGTASTPVAFWVSGACGRLELSISATSLNKWETTCRVAFVFAHAHKTVGTASAATAHLPTVAAACDTAGWKRCLHCSRSEAKSLSCNLFSTNGLALHARVYFHAQQAPSLPSVQPADAASGTSGTKRRRETAFDQRQAKAVESLLPSLAACGERMSQQQRHCEDRLKAYKRLRALDLLTDESHAALAGEVERQCKRATTITQDAIAHHRRRGWYERLRQSIRRGKIVALPLGSGGDLELPETDAERAQLLGGADARATRGHAYYELTVPSWRQKYNGTGATPFAPHEWIVKRDHCGFAVRQFVVAAGGSEMSELPTTLMDGDHFCVDDRTLQGHAYVHAAKEEQQKAQAVEAASMAAATGASVAAKEEQKTPAPPLRSVYARVQVPCTLVWSEARVSAADAVVGAVLKAHVTRASVSSVGENAEVAEPALKRARVGSA